MESLTLERPPLDDQVEALVDSTPTVEEFDPSDATTQALISDLAMKLRRNEVTAARYGLTLPQLYEFVKNPEVRRRIKQKRAIWESDGNLGERNKAYYGIVTLEAAPVLDRLLQDPTTPPGHIIKALEVSGRLGGVDGKQGQAAEGVAIGAQFSVQILFSGGPNGKPFVETITMPEAPIAPPTIDGDASP